MIDGQLDDPAWKAAPTDDRFLSTKSKPYGKPTPLPTVMQVSYDDTNLYVAVHCTYARPHPPSDAYSGDETTVLTEAESVAVIVDGVHAHSGAYEFAVSPAGVRADAELSDQGASQNLDWHGIWDVATAIDADGDGWTAEFAIPWGTIYMPASDDAFDIGIQFARHDPVTGETSLWTLHPPATELYDVKYFGHVDGLSRVHPGQRLLLLPYGALAFDSAAPVAQSQLTDFTGTNAQGRAYGGLYVRLRPPGPFRLDATVNPDFSAVNPDTALANFDRFELEYPEVRPFFAEDAPRFAFGATRYFFGDLGGQLFYSRRLGIITDTAGLTELVPIVSGVKSVLRAGGTEAALMNVETAAPKSGVVLEDNATVGRVTQTVDGQRFGAIVLNREGDSGAYTRGRRRLAARALRPPPRAARLRRGGAERGDRQRHERGGRGHGVVEEPGRVREGDAARHRQGLPRAARVLRDHGRARRDDRGRLHAGRAQRPRAAGVPRHAAVDRARPRQRRARLPARA